MRKRLICCVRAMGKVPVCTYVHCANTFSMACCDVSAYGNAHLIEKCNERALRWHLGESGQVHWRGRRVPLLIAMREGENEAYGKAWKQHWARRTVPMVVN